MRCGEQARFPGPSPIYPASRSPRSTLVAQGGCDGQVKGHLAANLNVGNDRVVLIDVLTQILPC